MRLSNICERIIFGFSPTHRAVIYLVITILLSSFCDYSENSKSYFAQQHNIFNLYFVKFSWGWTLLSLGVYFLANIFQENEEQLNVKTQIERLLKVTARITIATLVWYYGTGLFLMVEEYSGVCNLPNYLNKNTCKENGFVWKGFDISGHCFLLVWCNLVIIEEVSNLSKFPKRNDYNTSRNNAIKNTDFRWTEMMFYLICCVTMLWDLMIVCTNMFFHSATEKILGTTIAILSWAFLYKLIYNMYLSKYLGMRAKFGG